MRMQVSVCIPTYNGREFLADALRSVLSQTYADFELLVMDDDSTDGTRDVVQSFSDPRLRLHHNTRRYGLPGNWNRCLELASGEYVCIFHQDDLMLPENLAHKVQALDADASVMLVHSAAEVLVSPDAPAPLPSWEGQADEVLDGSACLRKLVLEGNFICCPSVVVRRRPLLEAGGFCEQLGFACDYEAWMRLAALGRVVFLCRPLVRYRWHGNNASHVFAQGRADEEVATACRRALDYYAAHTGRREEAAALAAAWAALLRVKRVNDDFRNYIHELETAKVWIIEQWQREETQHAEALRLLDERDRALAKACHELAEIIGSRSYQLAQKMARVPAVLAPEGSTRSRSLMKLIRAAQLWKAEGLSGLVSRTATKLFRGRKRAA